jgi:hypothetical protein
MLKHGPNDPFCCPTLEVVLTFRLEGDRLVHESQEPRRRSASPLKRYTVQSSTPCAPILS